MKRLLIPLVLLLVVAPAVADKRKQELFTSYFGPHTLPTTANIPTKTCQAVIVQADQIMLANGLETLSKKDLPIAADNLRACATSNLARLDRDLAVGLYGEVISELGRRDRTSK